MLWVNLIMDTFAALALASLPPSRSVMKKPRKSSDFIITPAMSRSILGTAALFIVVLLGMLFWFGEAITPYELSAFFTVFVMLQFWGMFNAEGIRVHPAADFLREGVMHFCRAVADPGGAVHYRDLGRGGVPHGTVDLERLAVDYRFDVVGDVGRRNRPHHPLFQPETRINRSQENID